MTPLPVSTKHRTLRSAPQPSGTARPPRILITGAAGAMATPLAHDLSTDHTLVGLDISPVREPEHWAEVHKLSVGDRDDVLRLVEDVDYAIHLAHGAYAGWEGLREVDIDGTRNVLDGALAGRCRRVILASTNHVSGWSELDNLAGLPAPVPIRPADPPRPDGLYSVAKLTMEAMGRAAAEGFGLPVSILRVGTFRAEDDVEKTAHEAEFSYLGDLDAVRRRLTQSWLSHADLFRIVREEIAAPETFRLRYGTSSTDEAVWSTAPLTWTVPAARRDATAG